MEQLSLRTASLTRALRRLWRQEDGTLVFEFLIFAPLMFWTFIATLAYFDLYRTEAVSDKAAMTIADMISRERNYITDSYLDGTQNLLTFLTRNDKTPGMRVSVLRFHDKDSTVNADDATDHFHVVWSEVRGNAELGAMTGQQARALTAKLPRMADGDKLILVETWTHYTSAYNMGLASIYNSRTVIDGDLSNTTHLKENTSTGTVGEFKNIVMTSFIFTQPRFQQTCFKNPSQALADQLC